MDAKFDSGVRTATGRYKERVKIAETEITMLRDQRTAWIAKLAVLDSMVLSPETSRGLREEGRRKLKELRVAMKAQLNQRRDAYVELEQTLACLLMEWARRVIRDGTDVFTKDTKIGITRQVLRYNGRCYLWVRETTKPGEISDPLPDEMPNLVVAERDVLGEEEWILLQQWMRVNTRPTI